MYKPNRITFIGQESVHKYEEFDTAFPLLAMYMDRTSINKQDNNLNKNRHKLPCADKHIYTFIDSNTIVQCRVQRIFL